MADKVKKVPVTKKSAAKTPAAKISASKAVSAKAPTAKASAAKAPASKTPAAKPAVPVLPPVEQFWSLRLKAAKEAFEDNNYHVHIAESLEDAKNLALKEIIPACKPGTITFGGSQTLAQSGLLAALREQKKIKIMDTLDYTRPPEEMYELRRQALLADLMITSVNAATMDGKLALLDGFGNRSAAVQFGPKKVLLLISRNKLVETISEAIERTKVIAAPMNAMRLSKKTPCVKTGECMDCKSPDRICKVWTLMEKCTKKDRIHIILINQDAGF